MSFKPNDKVVCVGGGFQPSGPGIDTNFSENYRFYGFKPTPNDGRVYVVDAFIPKSDRLRTNGLVLIGSTVVHRPTGREVGWLAEDFRLVSEVGHPAVNLKEEQPA